MKRWLWIILLLPVSPLVAKDKKLGGYVLDPAAFRKIQTYCVDTHNLPPREVKVINQFILRESKPSGLLARLPWRRLATCREGDADAIVRPEFPPIVWGVFSCAGQSTGCSWYSGQGRPAPIYETRQVLMMHMSDGESNGFETEVLEHDALYFVVRNLIHDWQNLPGTLHAAAF